MLLLPISLIAELAGFYSLRNVVLCHGGVGESDLAVEGAAELMSGSSGLAVSNVDNGDLLRWLDDKSVAADLEATLLLCPDIASEGSSLEGHPLMDHFYWITPYDNALANLSLRFDSNFVTYRTDIDGGKYELTERYKVKRGPVHSIKLGSWSEDEGLDVPVPDKWLRRNMAGAALVDAVNMQGGHGWWPISYGPGDETRMHGCIPSIVSELRAALNFTTKYKNVEDRQYGSKNASTGAWSGLVGELEAGRADMTSSGLTVTLERAVAIDFTDRIIEDGRTVIISRETKRQRIDILAHAKIFSPFEWCLCFFTFLASSFCYMLTGRSKLKEKKKKSFSQEFYHASEEVYNSALNLTFSARGIRPSRAIIALTAGVSYFLLFSHYSADLTAVITVLPPAPAITSFQDILDQGYTVYVRKGTAEESFLKSAPKDRPIGQINRISVDSMSDILETMRWQPKQRLAIYASYLGIWKPQIMPVVNFDEFSPTHMALGLRKDSELKAAFNFYIRQLDRSGVRKELLDTCFKRRKLRDLHFEEPASALGYDSVFFPVVALLAGLVFAVASTLAEKCYTSK